MTRIVFPDGAPPPAVKRATDAEVAYAVSLRGVELDTRAALNDAGLFSRRLAKVTCPYCERLVTPFFSARTKLLGMGRRWFGVQDSLSDPRRREPFEEWLCACGSCGGEYRLTTHAPD